MKDFIRFMFIVDKFRKDHENLVQLASKFNGFAKLYIARNIQLNSFFKE